MASDDTVRLESLVSALRLRVRILTWALLIVGLLSLFATRLVPGFRTSALTAEEIRVERGGFSAGLTPGSLWLGPDDWPLAAFQVSFLDGTTMLTLRGRSEDATHSEIQLYSGASASVEASALPGPDSEGGPSARLLASPHRSGNASAVAALMLAPSRDEKSVLQVASTEPPTLIMHGPEGEDSAVRFQRGGLELIDRYDEHGGGITRRLAFEP